MDGFYVILMILSSVTSDTVLDVPSPGNHILQLEQMITDLKAQSQVQAQNNAVVLTSVLSKLTATTDELKDVKAEMNTFKTDYETQMNTLKKDYETLEAELDLVKNLTVKNEEKIVSLCQSSANNQYPVVCVKSDLNTTDVENLVSDVITLKSDMTYVKSNLSHSEAYLEIIGGGMVNLTDQISFTETRYLTVSSDLSRVSTQQTHLTSEANSLENNIMELQRNVTSLLKESSANSRALMEIQHGDTAFEMVQLPNTRHFSQNDIIKFNNIRFKTPNLSGLESGKFTPPVAGTYMFWMNGIIKESNINALVHIQTKDKNIGFAYGRTGPNDEYHTCSGITVAFLQKGEQVWFNSTSSGVQFMGLSHYGGALLRAH